MISLNEWKFHSKKLANQFMHLQSHLFLVPRTRCLIGKGASTDKNSSPQLISTVSIDFPVSISVDWIQLVKHEYVAASMSQQ